ncbi:nuclear transport factor 2 family protein [Sulfitobacter pontiacus]|uniref:nuclear transport factor 2 family protein n=1 Tax=Sulfitobacter pontiacus TaxID=60137 RepID=UPI002759C38E|nr:nuclear transport factor 2 family protein [Sulfitobacter pontiacus]GLO79877.1 hypothetical protein MACH23_32980 [Sulfitobacter pontiacus]
MTDMQMELQKLIDESAIREVTVQFADAATRGDIADFGATWDKDGRFAIGEPPRVDASGFDAIVSTFQSLRAERKFFFQLAMQGPISIRGDVATASCLGYEAAQGPGESNYRNLFRTTDRLRRVDGRWVFTERHFRYVWLDTTAFGGIGFRI